MMGQCMNQNINYKEDAYMNEDRGEDELIVMAPIGMGGKSKGYRENEAEGHNADGLFEDDDSDNDEQI